VRRYKGWSLQCVLITSWQIDQIQLSSTKRRSSYGGRKVASLIVNISTGRMKNSLSGASNQTIQATLVRNPFLFNRLSVRHIQMIYQNVIGHVWKYNQRYICEVRASVKEVNCAEAPPPRAPGRDRSPQIVISRQYLLETDPQCWQVRNNSDDTEQKPRRNEARNPPIQISGRTRLDAPGTSGNN